MFGSVFGENILARSALSRFGTADDVVITTVDIDGDGTTFAELLHVDVFSTLIVVDGVDGRRDSRSDDLSISHFVLF